MYRLYSNKAQTRFYYQKLNTKGVVIGKNHECTEITKNSKQFGYTSTISGLILLETVDDFSIDEITGKYQPFFSISPMDCYYTNGEFDIIAWCDYLNDK